MIAVDTSVVVAAFASWHEGHESALEVMAERPRIPAQVLTESYSVLTRLPPPHRVAPQLVVEFLEDRLAELPLQVAPETLAALVISAPDLGITGGAIYDAIVAITAMEHKARLITRDVRGGRVYREIGVDFELLGDD